MNLSKTGMIADLMWYEIINHAKNIELVDFIVMASHGPGIISFNENNYDIDKACLSSAKTNNHFSFAKKGFLFLLLHVINFQTSAIFGH